MAGELASIKAKFLELEPTAPADAPINTVFADSTNGNKLSTKTSGGVTTPIDGTTSSDLFIKNVIAGEIIQINTPVSVDPTTGKYVSAESDRANAQNVEGYTLQPAVGVDASINILLVGPNLSGFLTGLGFAPGDEIFLGEAGGFTNDVSTFSDNNDTVMKLGIAAPEAGLASTEAKDLIMQTEVIFTA